MRAWALAAIGALILAGCASKPQITVEDVKEAMVESGMGTREKVESIQLEKLVQIAKDDTENGACSFDKDKLGLLLAVASDEGGPEQVRYHRVIAKKHCPDRLPLIDNLIVEQGLSH